MANLTNKEIVQADVDSIYIGNIYTVEANLELPLEGKNGSKISWTSDRPYIISPEGVVTRPREGAGNRDVVLIANVTYGDISMTRQFDVTVLAIKSNVKIIDAQTVKEIIPKGKDYQLPGVVIVERDDGTLSTANVVWNDPVDFSSMQEGKYDFTAQQLPETNVIPKAVIEIKADHCSDDKRVISKDVEKADYGDVKITGGFFNENRLRAEEFLVNLNTDTLLYNFREAAGLDLKGAEPMTGWDAPESLLKGHTTGHYLSAIALAYGGNTENKEKLGIIITYMIDSLAECQDAMEKSGKFNYGFLSGYSEEQFDKLQEYVVYPKIWAPYYTLHKILSGLIDCYEYAENNKALDIAAKIGIWIYNRLSKLPEEQLQKMWAMYIAGEFGGINESLARLAEFIDKPEYIAAAKLFDNERLFYPMARNVDTLGGIHANQHVPQIIGALEIFARTGNKEYYDIARNFWHFCTSAHIYNIGGVGEGEMFQDPNKIGTILTEKTAESCVSYNMLKLTSMLFEYEPKSEYMDYFERTLYNHIAVTQDQSGPVGGSTYFMPLEPGGEKEYDTGENSCCHGTGLENHVKYQDAIYYFDKESKSIYVNLYIPSKLSACDTDLSIESDFLLKTGGHKVIVKVDRAGFENLLLRIPVWSKKGIKIKVNNIDKDYETKDGYAVITSLNNGDEIEIEFDFALLTTATIDAPDTVSLQYGPLVMTALKDSTEFITLKKGFENDLQQKSDFDFVLEDQNLKFVPNYYANKGKYHAYFKID